jgi:predicted AAA+ superfamily ATPase
MALSNHERVGKALDLLKAGLGPFAEREIKSAIATHSITLQSVRSFADDPLLAKKAISAWDASALLKLMWETWNEVFRRTLGFPERSLVSEIRDWRNKWAHQQTFSSDDTDRSLDSIERLLTAVSAEQSEEVRRMKLELRRLVADEQARGERRKSAGIAIEGQPAASLKPWREVITPHADVASGRYQQAEFAADLWQVYLNEGTDEYRKPAEFFRRTFLTNSLGQLLVGGLRRVATGHGDPVVQLQTNFGGGKTHSMLALYHLFSGTPATELPGIEEVLQEAGVKALPKANRVVLVGNKISPGNPSVKPDGTTVRTLWGEIAWQLGGRKAYERIRKDDEHATSPGDALRELFNEYGPCLILVDEWVAYARQLHDQSDLPGGGFETQFSFAQALTESAKLARNCLLVISLPASDTATSPHALANEEEVGGVRGQEALARLRNVVGRLESSWTPATAEEGFEIVRRRLFEPMRADHFKLMDATAREFAEMYRTQQQEFPPECRESDYEKRMKSAFPIHPEVFARLYEDWSTLVKFQRTRGVLRLMAAVIHSLWEKGDRNPLIMPANIPVDDPRVRDELTRYLSDNWKPIIEKDVDGPDSLPLSIDAEVPNLGKFSACRRVARVIYLGSAPITSAANKGVEDRRVKLGCVMPGETPAVFGDALRRLSQVATFLYADGTRYWYDTQPTVTKLADDRAEQLKRNPDKVTHELERRLRDNLAQRGDFNKIHPLPASGADVPDDTDARLVVLGTDYPYGKGGGSPAEVAARAILEQRGNAPRLFRNTLVFLAPDKQRLEDLDEGLRKYLAWESIVAEQDQLDLRPHQVKQAAAQLKSADGAVTARLPETYQWLLVPEQPSAQGPMNWTAIRLTGQDGLALRASKKLQKARIAAGLADSGSPTWTRTRDLRINSPSLYRLSYRGIERPRYYWRRGVRSTGLGPGDPRINSPSRSGERPGDALDGFLQVVHGGGEGDADAAFGAEGGAGHQGDAVFQQVFAEGQVVGGRDLAGGVELADGRADVREGVEGAAAFYALHAGDGVEAVHHEAMAFPEGGQHGLDAGLVAVEGRLRRHLGDGGGVGGALGLDVVHGGDDVRRAGAVADAPAGHGVGLGHAVEHHGAVVQVRAGVEDVVVGAVRHEDVLVHVVAGDQHVWMAAQHLAQGGQFFLAVDGAAGVGGAVDDQHPGPGGDGRFQLCRGDLEALIDAGVDDDRHAVGQDDHVRIRDPVGGRDDDFVARIDEGLGQVVEALLAAAGHQHLVGGVGEAVFPLELVDDRLLQAGGAAHGGVLGEARVDGGDGRVLDVLGGVEIRFAHAQADDVPAFGLEFGGLRRDGQGRGGLDVLNAAGEFHGKAFDGSGARMRRMIRMVNF